MSTDKDILVLLEQQADNFPVLKQLIAEKGMRPSVVFLPQMIRQISEELNRNTTLLLEAIEYLDVVKFMSHLVYNVHSNFTDDIIAILCSNRTVTSLEGSVAKEATDDFTFSSKEALEEFLDNNKALLAIYIYSMVNLTTFKT